MLDRNGSLVLAFYEYYSSMPLSNNNALLKQYYISKLMLCNLIEYGIDKGEFKKFNINAVVDLLLFSYQGVQMLSIIITNIDEYWGKYYAYYRELEKTLDKIEI